MISVTCAYLSLFESGVLQQRAEQAWTHLTPCDACPWDCRKDRLAGRLGVCRTGKLARVASYGPHMGEEKVLSGRSGSGTIFFSRCNMACQYCQNWEISQADAGQEVEPETLASIMLKLQELGCHNINLVSPSHVIPQILSALVVAAGRGLRLPLVYNTGGYDSLNMLVLLDGIIDIYMPDLKYASSQIGLHYSKVRNYPQVSQAAVLEMHRQVGTLQINDLGLAVRGLLVRHLVLPNDLAGTQAIINFLATQVSRDTYLNLMDQYQPAYQVSRLPNQFPKLKRAITPGEYLAAVDMAREAGMLRLAGESFPDHNLW